MDDNQILMKGGTEDDIRKYAEANGATDIRYVPTEKELKEMGFVKNFNVSGTMQFWNYYDLRLYDGKPFIIGLTEVYPQSREDLEAIIRSLTP